MSTHNPAEYRPCVGAMMVNAAGQAFVGKRIDNREGDWWQMPQGGVDPDEDPDKALVRELAEEAGVLPEHLHIVARLPGELFYDLPADLRATLWGGRYKGQRQRWYLVRYTGRDDQIDLDAYAHPEFCEWKWVEPAQLPGMIVPFKRAIYQAVVDGFSDKLSD